MAKSAERTVLGLNGAYGTDVIEGAATANTGPYVALIAKGATVITSLTGNWSANPGSVEDEELTGIFTSVTISSGKLYCKKAVETPTVTTIGTVT